MANTVRILRSTTAGAVPASLVSGQIAINENDGRLYYRSAAGVVTQFSAGATSVVEYATTASFPGTGSSAVLYLATDTRRLYSWTGSVYAEVGAVSSYDSRWDVFLPPAPTGVSGTAASGQVALAWTAPTVLSQTPITDYVVQYSSNGGSTWTTFSDGTSASASATVTGLTNGTAYTFRVAAVNAIGTGAYSTASSVTPTSAPLLTRITNGTNGSFTGSGTAASPFVATSYLGGFGSSVRFQSTSACTIQVRYNATNDGDGFLQFGFYLDAGGTLYSYGGGNGAGTDRVVSFSIAANAIFRVGVDNAGTFTNLRIWATP